MSSTRWKTGLLAISILMLGVLAFLVMSVPQRKGAPDWTGQLIEGGWMAWSFPVALFFWLIAVVLIVFSVLALRFPEQPRRGILGIYTTRGDRLFITLLGSAFINIGWLSATDQPQWQALFLCLVWAAGVFRLV